MTSAEGSQSGAAAEQAFNFRAMSDDQIMFLGRAVELAGEHDWEEERSDKAETAVKNFYIGALTMLLGEDPDRAKTILRRQTLSNDRWDVLVAMRYAPTLATHDFPLARDIVAYGYRDDHPRGWDMEGRVSDTAIDSHIEIDKRATPKQIADLDVATEAALQAIDWPLPPGLAT